LTPDVLVAASAPAVQEKYGVTPLFQPASATLLPPDEAVDMASPDALTSG